MKWIVSAVMVVVLCGWMALPSSGAVIVVEGGLIKLTLESYDPAKFPTVSTIIDIAGVDVENPDVDDQFEIARQASLLSLSSEGWGLQELVDAGNEIYTGPDQWRGGLIIQDPPRWTGRFVQTSIYVPGNSEELTDLFGYELNEEALTGPAWEPQYSLVFHTNEWVARGNHDIGETPNNFGVITGGMSGTWHQTAVTNWGRFSIEAAPIPEPTTLALIAIGLAGAGLVARRRKRV